MIVLRANQELKMTFERLIQTMGVNVQWNGLFVVMNNFIILQGEVRSLFFHFDSRKAAENIIDVNVKEEDIKDTAGEPQVQDVVNMILYAFGKWGSINGLRVEKNYEQLGSLFGAILRGISVEPEYTPEYFRFYKNGIRITYEEVVEAALEAREAVLEEEAPEETPGLWHKVVWQQAVAAFERVDMTAEERNGGRLGNNFYRVGYLCPGCGKKLHMTVYPRGKEFRIETPEGIVLLARAYTCASCNCFYTPRPYKMLSEGDIYRMDFGEDQKAYEDYLELLGKNGERTASYRYNEYEDGRLPQGGAAAPADGESLEELCENLPEYTDPEFEELMGRIEEGFFPEKSVAACEKTIRAEKRKREKRRRKEPRGGEVSAREREERAVQADVEPTERGREEHIRQDAVQTAVQTARHTARQDGRQSARQTARQDDVEPSAGEREEHTRQDARQTARQDGRQDARQDARQAARQAARQSARQDDRQSAVQTVRHTQKAAGENLPQQTEAADPQEAEAARRRAGEVRKKYEARLGVLERMSENQLGELRRQLEGEKYLPAEDRQRYIGQVEQARQQQKLGRLTRKVETCLDKNYAAMKRVRDEVRREKLPEAMKEDLLLRLQERMDGQAKREVKQMMEHMPARMDQARYNAFTDKLKEYEGVDLSPYESSLKERRKEAEQQEIAGMVRRARKNTREDVTELMERLWAQNFSQELVLPYLNKLENRVRELDEDAIANLLGDTAHMSFEDGLEAYEAIENGDFLPDLKANALEMLGKRLAKIKTDESELLVGKLREELEKAGIAENPRHHFYPARKVLLKQASPEEVEVIDFAVASYAAGRGSFEYPILVVDTSRNRSGGEGMILTPEHLYYSTLLTSYGIPVTDIERITASTGLLNRGIYVRRRNGQKIKLPYAVEAKELSAYARVLDEFVRYLQEKPDSRKVSYLAREKHENICCFRCGYVYRGGSVCPKCGFKNNV